MNYEEIATKASHLKEQAQKVPDPTYGNYRGVIQNYKQILNDMLVLIRELAKNKDSQ
jgi:hypothetical protein